MITGCELYHPNEPQKCLTCDSEFGFYAVGAKKDEADVYQKCKFEGYLVYYGLGFVGLFLGLLMN